MWELFAASITFATETKHKTAVCWPAGVHLALKSSQILEAKAKERHIGSESNVTERADTIQLLEHTLPIRFDGTGAWRVLAVEVSVQDFYGLLVHCGLKLTSEECRSGQLLWIRRDGATELRRWDRLGKNCELLIYLDTNEVVWFEIVGRAAAPVHNVLVLTFTP